MYQLTIEQQRRFLTSLDKGLFKNSCWRWHGPRSGSKAQPVFNLNHRKISARRIAYILTKRIELSPKVYLLPTVCGDTDCLNPDHMTPMVGGGNLRRVKCKRGHDMTDETNIYITGQGKRACRQCIRITGKARRERYLREGRGWGRKYQRAA